MTEEDKETPLPPPPAIDEEEQEQQPQPPTPTHPAEEDEIEKEVEDRFLNIVSTYVSKETGLPQDKIRLILEDLVREEPSFAEKMKKAIGQIRNVIDSLSVGKISKEVADRTMARIIRSIGQDAIRYVRRELVEEDSDMVSWMKHLERMAQKMMILSRLFDIAMPHRDNTTDTLVKLIEINNKKYDQMFTMMMNLMQQLLEKEKKQEIEKLEERLNKLEEKLTKTLDELKSMSILGTPKIEEESEVNEIIETLREELESIRQQLEELKSQPQTLQQTPADSIQQLEQLADTIERMKSILEKFGYKVREVSGGEEEVKKKDIEEIKASAWAEAFKQHIAPAIAEIIKNPGKIASLIKTISSLRRELASQAAEIEEQQEEIPEELRLGETEEEKNEQ